MKKRYFDEIDNMHPDMVVGNLAEFVGRYPDYKLDVVSVYLLSSILARQLNLHFLPKSTNANEAPQI